MSKTYKNLSKYQSTLKNKYKIADLYENDIYFNTIDKIARRYRTKPAYIREAIKAATGKTPAELHRDRRLQRQEKAVTLLCQGYKKKDIALALGISGYTLRQDLKKTY